MCHAVVAMVNRILRIARSLLAKPRARLRHRRVEENPTLLDEEHAIGDCERAVDAVLGEQRGNAKSADVGEKLVRSVDVELRRRLVEKEELRAECERRREADALQLAARELVVRPPQVRNVERSERPLDPRPDLARLDTEVLEPECNLVLDEAHHDLVLRILEQRRDRSGENGRPRRRVSSPATVTEPENRPPWKCGTSPARARSSVDLPEPEGPSRTTTSPRRSSSETSRSATEPPG